MRACSSASGTPASSIPSFASAVSKPDPGPIPLGNESVRSGSVKVRLPRCTLATMLCHRMIALFVAALAGGCAHLPNCPGKGGPHWSEWTSPHFRVLTDVEDETDAEMLATQLEHFRAAIV